MQILNYYCGGTGKVTGFFYDTEKKTYKSLSFNRDEWFDEKTDLIKPEFKRPGDIEYHFPTLVDLEIQEKRLRRQVGFVEDPDMVLDFGAFRR